MTFFSGQSLSQITNNFCALISLVCLTILINNPVQAKSTGFTSNIIHVDEAKLMAEYWQQSLVAQNGKNASAVLMDSKQIQAFNEQQFSRGTYLKKPLTFPDKLAADTIAKFIRAISKPASSERFYADGKKLSEQDYQDYEKRMNLDSLKGYQDVRFAIVVKRTSLRTYPTLDRVFNAKMDLDLDRFQETGAFPGEPLAVVHTSTDGEWHFVRSYNYRAWVQNKDIAFAERTQVEDFIADKNRLVVTGDKVFTTFNPSMPQTSEVQLDMGVSLPLISHSDYGKYQLHGHNPYTGHIVLLPTRNADGNLKLEPTLIPRKADVNIGYLPFTQENVINQAFKFLGERYGWGHDYNGRDCTGFVGEIYKTFGILMPRNSGQQGKDVYGENIRFAKSVKPAQKLADLENLQVGDLLYLPGHVAMFLGYDQGKPFIIHDVYGLGYVDDKGNQVTGILNGVSVTPLLPFKGYIKSLYNIKRIR
ncbi:SH3 domain-containing protein [Thalassotalea sp. PS06]|uniref:SH3 domain-containing protein n=1 Tax=Thalassotalea sp. PS06 TaxID=2594005 RepID=UPI001161DBDC|nr:SH3 domain-containing protein [Thalassotalea sp. PS06]QDP01697.1 glycoside hydrolase [Thalassotalea sp. PS06]